MGSSVSLCQATNSAASTVVATTSEREDAIFSSIQDDSGPASLSSQSPLSSNQTNSMSKVSPASAQNGEAVSESDESGQASQSSNSGYEESRGYQPLMSLQTFATKSGQEEGSQLSSPTASDIPSGLQSIHALANPSRTTSPSDLPCLTPQYAKNLAARRRSETNQTRLPASDPDDREFAHDFSTMIFSDAAEPSMQPTGHGALQPAAQSPAPHQNGDALMPNDGNQEVDGNVNTTAPSLPMFLAVPCPIGDATSSQRSADSGGNTPSGNSNDICAIKTVPSVDSIDNFSLDSEGAEEL